MTHMSPSPTPNRGARIDVVANELSDRQTLPFLEKWEKVNGGVAEPRIHTLAQMVRNRHPWAEAAWVMRLHDMRMLEVSGQYLMVTYPHCRLYEALSAVGYWSHFAFPTPRGCWENYLEYYAKLKPEALVGLLSGLPGNTPQADVLDAACGYLWGPCDLYFTAGRP